MSHMHYLPLAPGFFAILVGLFLIVLILRSVRYAYESLGVSSNTAIFLLLATIKVQGPRSYLMATLYSAAPN